MKRIILSLVLILISASSKGDKWLVITQEFAETNKGYFIEPNYFDYAVTTDSVYVCALQSKIDFPELFIGVVCDTVELTQDNFPQDTTLINQ